MKLLLQYLSRHKGLIALALLLAAVNQVFSLFDPYIFGKYIIDPYASNPGKWTEGQFIRGIILGLGLLIGTAMISRIAKAFQDYTVNVVIQKFGARIYTDGLRHALRLPFSDFEDQRSGETLSVLQKVRQDCEKFINAFVNILFTTIVAGAHLFWWCAAAWLAYQYPQQEDKGDTEKHCERDYRTGGQHYREPSQYRAGKKPRADEPGNTPPECYYHQDTGAGTEEGAQHPQHQLCAGYVCQLPAPVYYVLSALLHIPR